MTVIADMAIEPMQVIIDQLAREKQAQQYAGRTAPDQGTNLPQSKVSDLLELPDMASHRLVDAEKYEEMKAAELLQRPAELTISEATHVEPSPATISPVSERNQPVDLTKILSEDKQPAGYCRYILRL